VHVPILDLMRMDLNGRGENLFSVCGIESPRIGGKVLKPEFGPLPSGTVTGGGLIPHMGEEGFSGPNFLQGMGLEVL